MRFGRRSYTMVNVSEHFETFSKTCRDYFANGVLQQYAIDWLE